MENMVQGHPDPRKGKVTRDGMTPITRQEGRAFSKKSDSSQKGSMDHLVDYDQKFQKNVTQKETVDQLIDYEWPGK